MVASQVNLRVESAIRFEFPTAAFVGLTVKGRGAGAGAADSALAIGGRALRPRPQKAAVRLGAQRCGQGMEIIHFMLNLFIYLFFYLLLLMAARLETQRCNRSAAAAHSRLIFWCILQSAFFCDPRARTHARRSRSYMPRPSRTAARIAGAPA